MIKNEIIKKTLYTSLTFLIAFLINVEKGYAKDQFHASNSISYSEAEGNGFTEGKNCGLFTSSVSIDSYVNSYVDFKAYDKEGNNIVKPGYIIELKDAIKAGTWVGINVQEIHEAYYSVTATSTETVYTVSCEYRKPKFETRTKFCNTPVYHPCGTYREFVGFSYQSKKSEEMNQCKKNSYRCPSTISGDYLLYDIVLNSQTKVTSASKSYNIDLNNRIKKHIDGQIEDYVNANIGKIKYTPVNDYDEYIEDDLMITGSGIKKATKVVNGKELQGFIQSYTYSATKVCIDLKTGNITYKESECDISKNQIEIKNKIAKDGNEYWHYFVPLNIKSTEKFSIDVKGDKVFTTQQCINYINENPDEYFKLIEPKSSKISLPTTNDPVERIKFINQLERLEEHNTEDAGCKIKTGLTIPIIQRFYNEYKNPETGNMNFKGFNFYYRPIDINEPFPNGLTNTSIWYDWSKDANQDPDISKSYDSTTYVAAVGTNTDTIRKYTTPELPYTTWSNMKLEGTSEFIDFLEKNHIGGRTGEHDKPYKLGCGDANKNQTNEDGSKNYLYQEWCDNS